MRRIAHISDLHFGAHDPLVAEGLLQDLASVAPHLVVVSGDLTQRARAGQFRAAREYLQRISGPKLVVPGNHDMPLYNVVARFGWPLASYRRYITEDLEPTYHDDEIAVAGVNTARSNRWKDGRISPAQIEFLRNYFSQRSDPLCKILVAHHPFIPPIHDATATLVGGAAQALRTLEACGCHIILAGHLHEAYAGDVRPHHVEIKRSILVAQAGTAISWRRRNEYNAYNALAIDGPRLVLEVRAWNGKAFAPSRGTQYLLEEGGWRQS